MPASTRLTLARCRLIGTRCRAISTLRTFPARPVALRPAVQLPLIHSRRIRQAGELGTGLTRWR